LAAICAIQGRLALCATFVVVELSIFQSAIRACSAILVQELTLTSPWNTALDRQQEARGILCKQPHTYESISYITTSNIIMASEEPEIPMMEEPLLVEVSSSLLVPGLIALAVLGVVAYVVYTTFVLKKEKKETTEEPDDEDITTPNSIGMDDIAYIVKELSPDSVHMDILWAVVSTPEAIQYGLKMFNGVEKIRQARRDTDAQVVEPSKNKSSATAELFDLDEGGWDEANDDDDEDEETKKKVKLAQEAEEQKKMDREQLDKATGKTKILLEGFDEGVIGQAWVEKTLTTNGVWPPKDLGNLTNRKFEYKGKTVGPLEHPGLRRNICMVWGRLHSTLLNSHPELSTFFVCKMVGVSVRADVLTLLA
jgi:hypothetical protein